MTTKKLFWWDSYLKECEANVLKIENENVILDQTVFYAFSGGQASDSGKINGIPVKEAICSGDEISYTLSEKPNFKVHDRVKVEIDWNRRYRIMRLHSAAHVLFFLFSKKTGANVLIGSNVSDEKARLDYLYDENITKFMPELENEANEIFSNDIPVKIYFDEKIPNKRWWEPEGKPEWKCPCGGTHVKNLNEIGKVKLKRKNIGSGKERIEITLHTI